MVFNIIDLFLKQEKKARKHPTFTCCMQNDVTAVLGCLGSFHKKPKCILLVAIRVGSARKEFKFVIIIMNKEHKKLVKHPLQVV